MSLQDIFLPGSLGELGALFVAFSKSGNLHMMWMQRTVTEHKPTSQERVSALLALSYNHTCLQSLTLETLEVGI